MPGGSNRLVRSIAGMKRDLYNNSLSGSPKNREV